jgi:nucleoside diphosphate kinase
MTDATVVYITPDGLKRNHIGDILSRLESKG